MKHTLLAFFILSSTLLWAQTVQRKSVEGRIIANDNDVESVTVFNTSSNTGTITNSQGKFTINVALNDVLEISALQFEKMNITIGEEVMSSGKMTIFLVEHINKLNEILILPYGLSGNLAVDSESIKTFNPDLNAIYFGLANIDEYEFPDDKASAVENDALWETHRLQYGVNFVSIFGAVANQLFKGKKDKKSKNGFPQVSPTNETLIDVYSIAYISNTFNIPEDRVNEFIAYVEKNNFDYSLLDEGKEVELIEHLVKSSKEFLNKPSEKD